MTVASASLAKRPRKAYHDQHDLYDHAYVNRAGKTWPVAVAKARFSELIDCAIADGPQIVTRKGRVAVVVVAAEEWERKTNRKGTLADFFAASPLRGSDIQIERSSDSARNVEL